jgi:hypothetical protein
MPVNSGGVFRFAAQIILAENPYNKGRYRISASHYCLADVVTPILSFKALVRHPQL